MRPRCEAEGSRLGLSFLALVLLAACQPASGVWCGSELTRMVKIICRGCIYDPMHPSHTLKRSKGVGALFKRGTGEERGKRGIVEECCYRSCTWDHIKTYYCSNSCWPNGRPE